MQPTDDNHHFMSRAVELAQRGEGWVEPNPMVGCVVVRDGQIVGEGWHQQFGGPHAEVNALEQAGEQAQGATLYVTLEPCCHTGKTPPCTQAVIDAGIARVVVGVQDPFQAVAGQGLQQLREAGLQVECGVLQEDATHLIRAFTKRVVTGKPWVIAKWAMTLDGHLATHTGDSQWISSPASRQIVHRLRGIVDGIAVGSGTADIDDPLLTARPPGPRTATRVVFDSTARLSTTSQLVRTTDQAPLLLFVGEAADPASIQRLTDAGCEVLSVPGSGSQQLAGCLEHLGQRDWTNLLVEGGSQLLGAFFDAGLVDEVHVFVAPKVSGGATAPSPVGGAGQSLMQQATGLERLQVEQVEGDTYVQGMVK